MRPGGIPLIERQLSQRPSGGSSQSRCLSLFVGLETALIWSHLPCSSWDNSKFFSEELASSRKAFNKNSIGFNTACLTSTNCEIKSTIGNQLLHLLFDWLILRLIPSLEGVNIHETESPTGFWIDQFSEDRVQNLMYLVLMLIILILLAHGIWVRHQMNGYWNLRMASFNLNLRVDEIRPCFLQGCFLYRWLWLRLWLTVIHWLWFWNCLIGLSWLIAIGLICTIYMNIYCNWLLFFAWFSSFTSWLSSNHCSTLSAIVCFLWWILSWICSIIIRNWSRIRRRCHVVLLFLFNIIFLFRFLRILLFIFIFFFIIIIFQIKFLSFPSCFLFFFFLCFFCFFFRLYVSLAWWWWRV